MIEKNLCGPHSRNLKKNVRITGLESSSSVVFNFFQVADPEVKQFVVADPTQINANKHDSNFQPKIT